MSHVMKTVMLVCVLFSFGVCCGLQGQRLVKRKQKIADFAPKSRKSKLASLYCQRHLQWLTRVIFDDEWFQCMFSHGFGFMVVSKILKKGPIIKIIKIQSGTNDYLRS